MNSLICIIAFEADDLNRLSWPDFMSKGKKNLL